METSRTVSHVYPRACVSTGGFCWKRVFRKTNPEPQTTVSIAPIDVLESRKPSKCEFWNTGARMKWNESCRIHFLFYLHELHQRLIHAIDSPSFQESWMDWDVDFANLVSILPKTSSSMRRYPTDSLTSFDPDKTKANTYLRRLEWIQETVRKRGSCVQNWIPHCKIVSRMLCSIPSIQQSMTRT